jgi:isochorismate hydrolase
MTLADRYKQSISNQPCPYVLTVNSMTAEDQKTLEEMWANGISQRTILRLLRAEGYKTSNEAIMAHRTKTCKCPK